MILDLVFSPDPLLKQKSLPVGEVNDEIRRLMDNMLETMYDRDGIGLAAVQVGVLKRILIMDLEYGSSRYPDETSGKGKPIFMINPQIIEESEDQNSYEEGCLSFPKQYASVIRPRTVMVKYLDYDGNVQKLYCDELLATCVQHEIDHLNGINFIDHLSRMKRDRILKKLAKKQKSIEDENLPHRQL